MFSHEKLHVYQRSTQWLALSTAIVKALPRGNADLGNQLRRAALSIPLNIAEGAGKTSTSDKKRFYGIARGSTLECAAILDAIKILGFSDRSDLESGKNLLREIASMLSSLVLKWDVQAEGRGEVQVHAQAKG